MFEWVESGCALVPVHVRDDGVVHPLASHVLSSLWPKYQTRRAFRAIANAFVEILNAKGARSALDRHGLVLFSTNGSVVRDFMESVLQGIGGRFKGLAGGRAGRSVSMKAKARHRIKLFIGVFKKVLKLLFDQGVLGRNFSVIDGYDTELAVVRELNRLQAEKNRNRRPAEGEEADWRCDDGSWFRVAKERWVPKRTDDVRWFGRVMAALEKARAIPSVVLCTRFIGQTGRRAGKEAVPLSYLGWWRGSRFGPRFLTRNKGDGDDEELETPIADPLPAQLAAMTDGWRRRRDPQGRGMAEFRALGLRVDAGDAEAEAELAAAQLFLNEEGGDLTYEVYHDVFSRAMAGADGHVPATPHWLRHEYVFNRMRAIEARNLAPGEYKRARGALCDHMGWASADMLRCYDAFWTNLKRLEDAADHAADAEAKARSAMSARIELPAPAAGRAARVRSHDLRAFLQD